MYKKLILLSILLVHSITGFAQEIRKVAKTDLLKDFNILAMALEEAHSGLFWYTTEQEYEQLKSEIIHQIKSKNHHTEVAFYNLIAPLITITKEDHCDISLSDKTSNLLKESGKYFPFLIKYIEGKPYLYNDGIALEDKFNGYILTTINGKEVKKIRTKLFQTFASDGNILSSKYRWLDDVGFASLYAKTINWRPKEFNITAINPKDNEEISITLNPCTRAELSQSFENFQANLNKKDIPAKFELNGNIAILTINSFAGSDYKEAGMKFQKFIKQSFKSIRKNKIEHLIIDIRQNGGGTEGYEDYLFSYLTNEAYSKYKFVETNNTQYSFYEHTDYSSKKDQSGFEKIMKKEFAFHPTSGKYRRHKRIEKPEAPQEKPFLGNLYVLAGGVTYSGGAEFCSLVKENRSAFFIGEEVGGGYYGNTSGYSFTLTLPNSLIDIEIPIVRFVLDVNGQEKGTGVQPDFKVEPTINDFFNGIDTEMNFAIELIKKKRLR